MAPKVFIGSSVKGLEVAEAIQKELSHDADVVIWSQGIFRTTHVPIEDLMTALNQFDFAIFVFLPEDKRKIGDREALTVRDNVLFELGLFLGKLGRSRIFFIEPKSDAGPDLQLPSDFSGITPATYDGESKNLRATVSTALYEIKQSIRGLKTSEERDFLLYDSSKGLKTYHFKSKNSYLYKNDQRISPKSDATLEFLPDGTMKLERKNLEGRYEIELRPSGPDKPSIPKKHEQVRRLFRIVCECKVDGGQQKVRFVLKNTKSGAWESEETKEIRSIEWTLQEMYLQAISTADLLFRIDFEKPSILGNIYIRNLKIQEEEA